MGHPLISVLVCLAVAYALAIAIYPLIRRGDALSVTTVAIAFVGVLACLFIIPPEQVVVRAVTSLFNVDLVFRLIDFTRRRWRGELDSADFSDYCRFLIPFPLLLVVYGQKNRRRRPEQRRAPEFLRLSLGAAGIAAGFAMLFAANKIPTLQSSFALDHTVKLFIFTFTVESLSQAVCGLERLAGFDTRPLYDRVVFSHTPAGFWRRQNTRVQPWFYWNVFQPVGGRRSPARGIWATFLVSAILHEVGFSIALSQITGYQFIFFIIQAPAVMLSAALDRLAASWPGVGSAIARAITILWVGATSIFFLDGVDRIFPIYYASQRWLP